MGGTNNMHREMGNTTFLFENQMRRDHLECHIKGSFLLFFGSTARLRPWPPPQNPAEFLGGFSEDNIKINLMK
jgi:hypothetical protein